MFTAHQTTILHASRIKANIAEIKLVNSAEYKLLKIVAWHKMESIVSTLRKDGISQGIK